jgi:hypothetical protein
MLQHNILYGYVDAVVDRRTPRPARLLELSERHRARGRKWGRR